MRSTERCCQKKILLPSPMHMHVHAHTLWTINEQLQMALRFPHLAELALLCAGQGRPPESRFPQESQPFCFWLEPL